MMRTSRNNIALGVSTVAVAVLLSGCQALGIGGRGMARATTDGVITAQPINSGVEYLMAGREALARGHSVDAIEAFMVAKTFPEQMPAAYNGLAVAYSRIGRTDLSERFFLTAVALAPDDDRYRSNLALFYARNGQPKLAEPALAMASLQQAGTPALDAAVIPTAHSAPVARSLGGGVTVQSPGTHLRRVSRGEVVLHSGGNLVPTAGPAPAARRVVIEVGASRPQAYPVRVALTEPKRTAAEREQAYPIRIQLRD